MLILAQTLILFLTLANNRYFQPQLTPTTTHRNKVGFIRQLRCIWPYLDSSTACTIATSIVHSKRDYCNSLYYKLPKSQLSRLQQIRNSLARTVVRAPKSCHITPILRSFYWLRITECIEYKLRSLTYKVLTTTQTPISHLCSTSSLFIRRYSCSATFIIISKSNWSLLPLWFTLSLESAPFVSSSTSFWYQFLHFRLTYYFTHHFFFFWFTTLLIHNSSLSLSLPA